MGKVNGIILCGGKSSRMGKDKGLLKFDGKSLMENAISILKPYADQIIICSNNTNYKQFNYPVIPDIIKDIGPAAGILTGLNYSNTDYNIVISCDTPFVDAALIDHLLLSHKSNFDATIPVHGQHVEPLVGIYSKNFIKTLNKYIKQNILKMNRILKDSINIQFVDMKDELLRNKNLFFNINTPSDFDCFRMIKN
ncbi:MAG: molybdenum cofactor guanylyltransferase [Bacteroidetes bacterium]|jgi:molybdenum cofactor guanylyltransferase|nr:molybdenum cofactor guanylyltransferase [Bacteroidota bacterium]MBT5528229.1 molybdenum cofactor guanylyltransferase [Cytophagia bacterium]MBT3421268.1 molybdenum cofactor guanylyltransferase [Bacteroidota bacterium]MBT4337063.1 molybdenum cofactor guanylyltransferase [Bacteroidota bacterium]MBT4969905.1 molybdenum cofactor guanylyltransferase [Bacteroidota bacterium]